MSYVITVEFNLKPGTMVEFRKLMDRNAQNSCDLEPGCKRFDVLVPTGNDNQVFLYEIYDDKAAFDAHLKTQHFLTFNQESSVHVVSKRIAEFELVYQASVQKE